MTLRTVVVDDEALPRQRVADLVRADNRLVLVGEADDGRSALDVIVEQRPDLVFLDIQMPELDGFQVIAALDDDAIPAIVFVTAYDAYAIRAFEVDAIDYLLKPVTEERFGLAFKRALARLRDVPREEGTRQVLAMLDAVANPPRQLERFAIRSGERTMFVPLDEVDWIEAFQNYVRLHAGVATHLLHVPMNTIEGVLDGERFLRIHRSHIVNVRRIAQLWSIAHGQFVIELASGQRLQSGRTYGDRIRRVLSNPF